MQHRLPHLAQRLFNVPLAIHPRKAEIVMAALGDRFGVTHLFRAGALPAGALADFEDDDTAGLYRPYSLLGGVAIIPIEGTLVMKLGTMRPFSGMCGYDGVRACLQQALSDPQVRAILLDVDSPGGEVAGCFDLADAIYSARGEKPLWGIADEMAYSAAYALISSCDRVLTTRTGGVGSVGVIAMHVDMSQALSKAGLTPTLLTYGDQKADGTETAPLPADVKDRFMVDINAMGELFVETVARNRNMPASLVRDTQAGTFMGAAGVTVGFADAVTTPQAALAALQAVT
ncbi:MAG: S49 family peptidase [Janthinobacterium lividum]